MERPQYKTEVFEGPLDLLLHLISKHKLNINDIPIFELVEQYIAYVQLMQEENMEIASEFLEMAARLVYIKTVSLLPVYEEAEQLKKELTGELLEYRDCKIMAGKLSEQAKGFDQLLLGQNGKDGIAQNGCHGTHTDQHGKLAAVLGIVMGGDQGDTAHDAHGDAPQEIGQEQGTDAFVFQQRCKGGFCGIRFRVNGSLGQRF